MIKKNRFILVICLFLGGCNGTSMSGSGNAGSAPAPTPTATQNAILTNNSVQTATSTVTPTPSAATTTTTASSSPNSPPNPNSSTPLTGIWDAKGYTCTSGAPAIEEISITQTATQFIGTKVTGDSCVPEGYISFQGTITAGVLSLRFNSGEPGKAVQFDPQLTPGSYTPTLIQINGDGVHGPILTLTPHQN